MDSTIPVAVAAPSGHGPSYYFGCLRCTSDAGVLHGLMCMGWKGWGKDGWTDKAWQQCLVHESSKDALRAYR
jgi:hypothetical protein